VSSSSVHEKTSSRSPGTGRPHIVRLKCYLCSYLLNLHPSVRRLPLCSIWQPDSRVFLVSSFLRSTRIPKFYKSLHHPSPCLFVRYLFSMKVNVKIFLSNPRSEVHLLLCRGGPPSLVFLLAIPNEEKIVEPFSAATLY